MDKRVWGEGVEALQVEVGFRSKVHFWVFAFLRELKEIASRFGKGWFSADQSFDGSLCLKSREGKVHFWVVGGVRMSLT